MFEELPVENVGDGEGTFIAGKPNPHLNLVQANECIIARAYLVRAFLDLNNADQQAWLEAQDIRRVTILGTQLVHQMDSFAGIIAFAGALVDPFEIDEFLRVAHEFILKAMEGNEAEFIASVQAFSDENQFEG
mgnify:CR=1 FL=1